jgi:hypothetical protein
MQRLRVALSSICLLAAVPAWASQVTITGDGTFGDFTAVLTYDDVDTLTVEITNTSPAANGGYITAIAFNNPGNAITGVTFSTTDADFDLIGDPSFQDDIDAQPLGHMDIGASTSSSWLGGGEPSKGIAVGVTETFTFEFTGTGLSGLTVADFIDEVSDQGEFFAVRFRGFEDGESDKVPGDRPPGQPIPEPASLITASIGALCAMAGMRLRGARSRSA